MIITAKELTAKMVAAGISRKQLAQELGVSIDTVRSWTYGRRGIGCCNPMRREVLAVLNLGRENE